MALRIKCISWSKMSTSTDKYIEKNCTSQQEKTSLVFLHVDARKEV